MRAFTPARLFLLLPMLILMPPALAGGDDAENPAAERADEALRLDSVRVNDGRDSDTATLVVRSPADGDPAHGDAAAELSVRLEALDAFHAQFEQQLLDARGNLLRTSRGELRARRPDRFRWEIIEPFPEVLIGDGETLWLWDPDLEQVTIRPYDERLRGTPALLLSGDPADLVADFEVERLPREGERTRFRLRPRAEDSLFESLEMVFEAGEPRGLVIHDGLGQRTRVRFENIDLDPQPDPDRFRFDIPEGADVLREEAAVSEPAGRAEGDSGDD
jgi:outer membrane lipoprotein carrier protein